MAFNGNFYHWCFAILVFTCLSPTLYSEAVTTQEANEKGETKEPASCSSGERTNLRCTYVGGISNAPSEVTEPFEEEGVVPCDIVAGPCVIVTTLPTSQGSFEGVALLQDTACTSTFTSFTAGTLIGNGCDLPGA